MEIFGFVLFYIIPFIVCTVVLPFVVAFLIKKTGRFEIEYKKILLLIVVIMIFSVGASFLWKQFVTDSFNWFQNSSYIGLSSLVV